MRFEQVRVAAMAYELPPRVVTSVEIEERLAPLYEGLRLPRGRLELMTGIRERRFWAGAVVPSAVAAVAGKRALEQVPHVRERVGLLAHCAVCRDRLEPATGAYVHRHLGLGPEVQVLDISNACLGLLNGMVLAAAMIETGQIEAALLVSGEDGWPLVERTIERLNTGSLDRQAIKPYFANLTIGAGAAAVVLCHERWAPTGSPRLIGGAARANSEANALCEGDTGSRGGLEMATEAEELLEAGIALATETWARFLETTGWTADAIAWTVGHQVGRAHQRRLLAALALEEARDFVTYPYLGNTGSAACPITLARLWESGGARGGDRVALLGIGSGLNCLMLGLEVP